MVETNAAAAVVVVIIIVAGYGITNLEAAIVTPFTATVTVNCFTLLCADRSLQRVFRRHNFR